MGNFVVTFFLFYLAFSSVQAKFQEVERPKPKPKYQYEYFQMVQQWPQSICNSEHCIGKPKAMFTIHGLWPQNYSTSLICDGSPFADEYIKSIREQLNLYWPTLLFKDNKSFWNHEWMIHGECSDPPFNPFQYFQKTLKIRKTYDLLAILNAAGLGPTTAALRNRDDIEKAIGAAIGQKPVLKCNTNTRTRDRQLSEVVLCLDEDGVKLIDCAKFVSTNCPLTFSWPPFVASE
ncbi:ribonuclease MC-like isoform X1 [Cucurbita pepo subsp. pepo]|uniref:ribonuclease MC-like isoform X1 n=1 Tax=Cucurbita pepo subsp. pepo TaxID=3664 RepID=UPI000C9D68A5|nr:ribonuclease MC-like isoform X1 [Cucurbita pepo subsp. pepo]